MNRSDGALLLLLFLGRRSSARGFLGLVGGALSRILDGFGRTVRGVLGCVSSTLRRAGGRVFHSFSGTSRSASSRTRGSAGSVFSGTRRILSGIDRGFRGVGGRRGRRSFGRLLLASRGRWSGRVFFLTATSDGCC